MEQQRPFGNKGSESRFSLTMQWNDKGLSATKVPKTDPDQVHFYTRMCDAMASVSDKYSQATPFRRKATANKDRPCGVLLRQERAALLRRRPRREAMPPQRKPALLRRRRRRRGARS